MSNIICTGCNRLFSNNKSLSLHFQHNQTCKSIHLNLNFTTSSNSAYQMLTRNKTKQWMDLLKEKKKGLILIHASTNKTFDKSMQAFQPNDYQNNFENTKDILTEEINVMATPIMEGTNQNNLLCILQNELSVNSFIFSFHNNEHIEANLPKLVKEINMPNYAYKNKLG